MHGLNPRTRVLGCRKGPACQSSRALCRLAGNAIPAEFCLVVVRGLAICYPQLFRDTAAPAEDLRRSARLAGTDAASALWAL